jgi:hypothetical protein
VNKSAKVVLVAVDITGVSRTALEPAGEEPMSNFSPKKKKMVGLVLCPLSVKTRAHAGGSERTGHGAERDDGGKRH